MLFIGYPPIFHTFETSMRYSISRNCFFALALFILSIDAAVAQRYSAHYRHDQQAWVDSVFNSLTPDQRLGQLFMVAAYSNRDSAHIQSLEKLIREQHIGGLIFFQGGPVRQARMTNHLQSISKVPLMLAMDAEWGIGMRLDSTIDYPRQMTLGAIQDDSLVHRFGQEVARQMKRMGMHINFAPVVDVNSNAANPVIGTRSFGEDRYNVARKGVAYMRGMQNERIMACAKHFPGHGDTDSDSHHTLPIIRHGYERLDSLELYPFKRMIDNGVGSMMVAHLYIPTLDNTPNLASTLSPKVVNGLLKDTLGFDGLIFTDALNMKGVSKYFGPGEVEMKALLAGNDVMEFAEDVPKAMQLIRKAVEEGRITQKEIDERCRKVLNAKAWFGLHHYRPVKVEGLVEDLNNGSAKAMLNELTASSLTLLFNKNAFPVRTDDGKRTASLVFGDGADNRFQQMLSRYAQIAHYNMDESTSQAERFRILDELKDHDRVILSIHGLSSRRSQNYGIDQTHLDVINELSYSTDLVINVFGNPYALSRLPGLEHAAALLFSFSQTDESEEFAAQAIFGGVAVSGRLPVTANRNFRVGDGVNSAKTRLGFTEPWQVGLDDQRLKDIDDIVKEAIDSKAIPGAQVLVARNGMVVYERQFGHHTYETERAVESDDVYDLASITKVAASLPAFMKLVDDGEVSVDDKVSDHVSRLRNTNKKNITFRDMLAHYAQLKPWIPFYWETLKDGGPDSTYYRAEPSDSFSIQVAEDLFLRKDYPDTMYKVIDDSELLSRKRYKYSDLGYYYMKELIEEKTSTALDAFTSEHFYRPLGLRHLGFFPRRMIPLEHIVPTEYDMGYRKQLLRGHVHDMGAAMLGGVGGHAGLFSNSHDLAVLMQLYLNEGTYGGKRYISEETIREFIKCQFCKNGNRRGIGFDKPEPDGNGGPTCDCVSYLSFGHTGFTGTMAWADPEKEIVYIFLSNRIYPDAENRKLLKMDVRTRIQQVIYDALRE